MDVLSNFALPMTQVPNSPEEDHNAELSVWKNGKLIELNEGGDYSIFYFGHTVTETSDELGNPKTVTMAYPVRIKKPVTPEKIITAACMEIYGITNLEDQTNLNAEIMRKFVNNSSDTDVKNHYKLVRWINDEIDIATGITVEKAKDIIINRINEYDTSPEVNSFIMNGATIWLDKDTRVGLMNSINIEKAAGRTESTLWFGTIHLTINCEVAIQFLSALELYALECYNKTAEHKSIVAGLNDVDEIMGYDYTTGYPEKLSITV